MTVTDGRSAFLFSSEDPAESIDPEPCGDSAGATVSRTGMEAADGTGTKDLSNDSQICVIEMPDFAEIII